MINDRDYYVGYQEPPPGRMILCHAVHVQSHRAACEKSQPQRGWSRGGLGQAVTCISCLTTLARLRRKTRP